jgi:hypothetical protein
MAHFAQLAGNEDFWNHTLDGLAVLVASGFLRVLKLQQPVRELAIVADSFHIKPLLRILQSADRYQVLALTRGRVRLFEGNRYVLDEIALAPGIPRTLTEALGEELTEPHQTVASYGRGPRPGPAMRHGHGSRNDEIDKDQGRFFRAVDRAILEHHSRPTALPLILAALPEHHPVFRRISHNPFLLDDGIKADPEALDDNELRDAAWQAIEPYYLAQLAEAVEAFETASNRGQAETELAKIAEATLAGRTETLLVETERRVPGRLDRATGGLAFDDLAHPEVDDLLDDLAELVLRKGGRVAVVPQAQMPSPTGAAAIYRF